LWETQLRAIGHHLSRGITQCYLPPDTGEGACLTPARKAGTRGLCVDACRLDWIVQCFTSLPTQYRLYGRRFLQVKRPNQWMLVELYVINWKLIIKHDLNIDTVAMLNGASKPVNFGFRGRGS